MLRVTSIHSTTSENIVLKLEGRIMADWVPTLERECRTALAQGQGVVLDCSHVSFVDQRGVEMFRGLSNGKVTILNCSAFIQDLLHH